MSPAQVLNQIQHAGCTLGACGDGDMARTLGDEIRRLRREHGYTLRGTARSLKISPSLLSLIEHNKHVPPSTLIVRLASYLGGDCDLWCGLAGSIHPDIQASLAEIAKDDPIFFRTMVSKFQGRN